MKKVFLDTNILIDFIQKRENFGDAVGIWKKADAGEIALYVSTLSYSNITYILRNLPQAELYKYLKTLTKGINMIALEPQHVLSALDNPVRDFEDMLQYQCALAADCDVVVTNNTKDFRDFCQLPLTTSHDFLQQFFS